MRQPHLWLRGIFLIPVIFICYKLWAEGRLYFLKYNIFHCTYSSITGACKLWSGNQLPVFRIKVLLEHGHAYFVYGFFHAITVELNSLQETVWHASLKYSLTFSLRNSLPNSFLEPCHFPPSTRNVGGEGDLCSLVLDQDGTLWLPQPIDYAEWCYVTSEVGS